MHIFQIIQLPQEHISVNLFYLQNLVSIYYSYLLIFQFLIPYMKTNTHHGLKTLIYKCDFFSQKIGLRFKQEAQYSTLTGGVVSILLIITFFVVFANTTLNTLNKDSISTQSYQTYQQDPTPLALSANNSFFFGMGFTGVNMNSGIRYFDIQMSYREYTTTGKIKKALKLVPCNKSVWETFQNQQLLKAYDQVGMNEWLCPQEEQVFQMRGKYTSQIFKFIKIGVVKCNQALDPSRRCATNAQISAYLNIYQQFSLNMYFVNTLLNPSQKKFVSYYLEDRYYFPFTLTYGLTANLFFSNYKINTDQSIWPNEQTNITQGGILENNAQIFPTLTTGTQYLKVYLRKASNTLMFTRVFKKVDDTLSYIGGLFSSIVCFLLVVGFYNQYSYELDVAKNIYKYDQQTLLDTNKFHFFSYLIYLFYSFLGVFGLQPKWTQMQHYDKSLKEIRKQMDIRLVFKKLFFIQKFANVILQQNQLKGLHLHDKITMKKAEQIRQNYLLPKILAIKIDSQLNKNQEQQFEHSQNSSELSYPSDSKDKNSCRNMSIQCGLQAKNIQRQKIKGKLQMMSDQVREEDGCNCNSNNLSRCQQMQKDKKQAKSARLRTIKVIKEAITNSLGSVQLHRYHQHDQTYMQILQIIKQLKDESQKGNLYSKKILKSISPQIKQLMHMQEDNSNEKSSLQQSSKIFSLNQKNSTIFVQQQISKKIKKINFAKSVVLKSITDIITQHQNKDCRTQKQNIQINSI